MNILAVETSTELCSVALLRGEELFVEEAIAENRHSELLLPMIRRVLARAGAKAAGMDAFAFGQGPGSFTGIRIACGIAQGLAFGAAKPVVPVPSLLALAAQAGTARVVAALDARMGEAYLAAYERRGAGWECAIAPSLVDRSALPPLPPGEWTAIGSGFDRHAWLREAYAGRLGMHVEGELPRAGAVARLAALDAAEGRAVNAERAAPLYLRDKVALTTQERQARP
ncbi:MAG TPA: tRNA (adenosine(37)-N6)-threonylcarbamoyltransferase complex dimerization subunit type 1 TsaB [Usitatibacter sp.]|nr:tRNA (adenosine(37)-N6)-threonylcarbamoyltransferase complex dimerization subunit type 1 TsaB [Usitatibacter sp.]